MIQKLFALLLGNKSDRDLKEIQPYVDLILAVEPSVQALDNDGLRAKTHEFRARLERAQSEDRSAIEDLRTRAELEEDADAKNVLFQQIDDLDKKAYEKAEAELAEFSFYVVIDANICAFYDSLVEVGVGEPLGQVILVGVHAKANWPAALTHPALGGGRKPVPPTNLFAGIKQLGLAWRFGDIAQ